MSNESEDTNKKFCVLKLQEDATTHFNLKQYKEAREALHKLTAQCKENTTKIYFSAMKCECCLRLREDSLASDVIQEIVNTAVSSKVMPDYVAAAAKDFNREKRHIRAYILYNAACRLYITDATDAANKIKSTFDDMKEMADKMAVSKGKVKRVLSNHMIPFMNMMLEKLVLIPDNEHEKVEQETWCYYDMAYCYCYLKDNKQELAMNEAGYKLMEKKLGDDAEKYKVTGLCYNNAGVACNFLGNTKGAEIAFESAIKVHKNATDYVNETERQNNIKLSIRNICYSIPSPINRPILPNRWVRM